MLTLFKTKIYSFTEIAVLSNFCSFVWIVHAHVLWKDQEKLLSAAEVIISSSVSIVSCSSNLQFRNACLNSMKVWKKRNLVLPLLSFRKFEVKQDLIHLHHRQSASLSPIFKLYTHKYYKVWYSQILWMCCSGVWDSWALNIHSYLIGEGDVREIHFQEQVLFHKGEECVCPSVREYLAVSTVYLNINKVINQNFYFHRWKNTLRVQMPQEPKSETFGPFRS